MFYIANLLSGYNCVLLVGFVDVFWAFYCCLFPTILLLSVCGVGWMFWRLVCHRLLVFCARKLSWEINCS